eukprot:TRINITY_DN4584_c0_g1_i2.p1 TRINITY_DN4584_c0_g1~~TRINITY_DN4584_c0_g1_i2.p1  ORF type:complete len:198 (+),score=66.49 TRINITY_DN4584_c0_g1_i2:513-1106(+)
MPPTSVAKELEAAWKLLMGWIRTPIPEDDPLYWCFMNFVRPDAHPNHKFSPDVRTKATNFYVMRNDQELWCMGAIFDERQLRQHAAAYGIPWPSPNDLAQNHQNTNPSSTSPSPTTSAITSVSSISSLPSSPSTPSSIKEPSPPKTQSSIEPSQSTPIQTPSSSLPISTNENETKSDDEEEEEEEDEMLKEVNSYLM